MITLSLWWFVGAGVILTIIGSMLVSILNAEARAVHSTNKATAKVAKLKDEMCELKYKFDVIKSELDEYKFKEAVADSVKKGGK